MRAAATDFSTARLLGVNAERVIGFAVLLSGLIAATVAVILTVQNPFVGPDFALRETIVVLVGVVVGGIDRLWTATSAASRSASRPVSSTACSRPTRASTCPRRCSRS